MLGSVVSPHQGEKRRRSSSSSFSDDEPLMVRHRRLKTQRNDGSSNGWAESNRLIELDIDQVPKKADDSPRHSSGWTRVNHPSGQQAELQASNGLNPTNCPASYQDLKTTNVGEDAEDHILVDVDNSQDIECPDAKTKEKAAAEPKDTPEAPQKNKKGKDAKELFHPVPYEHNWPARDPKWGQIPYADPPRARADSPPAHTSDAATTFELWEDRKTRLVKGRFIEVTTPDGDTKTIDQRDYLKVRLIDMRADETTGEPQRRPICWTWGEPKDWNDRQTLKIWNDRRRDTIERITQEPQWTEVERLYLAELVEEYPKASITELAERFNYRFKGDFTDNTAFRPSLLHPGRTLESVRAEYLEHKACYDAREMPKLQYIQTKKRVAGIRVTELRRQILAQFEQEKEIDRKVNKSEPVVVDPAGDLDEQFFQLAACGEPRSSEAAEIEK